MLFRLLGPVEVWVDNEELDAGSPQQRAVLAAMLAKPGQMITSEALIDRVWGETPPPGARSSLHAHLARIRRLLGAIEGSPARLVAGKGGYTLSVRAELVDVHQFRQLVKGARLSTDTGQRVTLLRQALGLWRGEALAGAPGPWAARTRDDWRWLRLDATVDWARAELDSGNAQAVLSPIADLVAEHPLTEPLWAVLIRALHASGRKAEALQRYASLRERLADELGSDPGAELQELHRAILRDQPITSAHQVPRRLPAIPAQLPPAVAGFVGRKTELARLDSILDDATDTPTAVAITAVSGTAGVGKTALVVHWAHRVRDRFPDGQLYVNLHGFNPSGLVMDPAQAIRHLLHALCVPAERIPADPEAQVAFYRSQLADRRMLVVLDNARNTAQVRPLLPGTASCLVLVTSRTKLSGLVAADAAHPIVVDTLSRAEARELLARRLGYGRAAAEPEAAEEIISCCARLPLALAIVAARGAAHPGLSLLTLANELRDSHDRLDALTTDDPATDVRAVFSWSYRTLTSEAARLFRLLSLHPGPDVSVPAAATLAAQPMPRTRQLFAELTTANMLVEAAGRYTVHDLLRAYATDLTGQVDAAEERHSATHRLLDHYLHSAYIAARHLDTKPDSLTIPPAQPGVLPDPTASDQEALDWFTKEHRGLLAAIAHAAASGFDRHTWQLAWASWTFFERQGHWHDWVNVGDMALAAAERLADPTVCARAHHSLAAAFVRLGRFDDAHTHLTQVLDIAVKGGDRIQQAHARYSLAHFWERQELPAKAIGHAETALEHYRASRHEAGQANALNMIGWLRAMLGDDLRALADCGEALALYEAIGDRHGQASTLHSLGHTHHKLGNHCPSISCFQQAASVFRELGDRYYEADTLTRLGDASNDAGDPRAARQAWLQALTILHDLDHPDADSVSAKLARMTLSG